MSPARPPAAYPAQDVQLALEELAREQAELLARQNAELRRQNEELRRANKIRGDFLATLSHELRTPLNSVMGYSELLLAGMGGELGPEQADYVKTIHRAGESLLGLLNDILDLAKIDAGKMHFNVLEFDLREPVVEAEELARSLARKKELLLVVDAPDPVPAVGDPQRVRQIALNLISNAVKFTPKGGRIIVAVREAPEGAALAVEDTGVGIDPALHQAVFEPFRQVDSQEGRRHLGTGLGLALVKKFALGMGGDVRLQSEPGRGSTFTVVLPFPSVQPEVLRVHGL